jgi:hypothetical protein
VGRGPFLRHCLISFRRWARAVALHWIASGAVIEEGRGAALDERELEEIVDAIDRARKAGR